MQGQSSPARAACSTAWMRCVCSAGVLPLGALVFWLMNELAQRLSKAPKTIAKQQMRILGIDPGLQTTGFGVVDVDMATSCATWPAAASAPPRSRWVTCPWRLKVLFDGIGEVVAPLRARRGHGGDRLRQRQPPVHPAAGPGRGACLTLVARATCPWPEYTALQMKKSRGRPRLRRQVPGAEMVRRLLDLPGSARHRRRRRPAGPRRRSWPSPTRTAGAATAPSLAGWRRSPKYWRPLGAPAQRRMRPMPINRYKGGRRPLTLAPLHPCRASLRSSNRADPRGRPDG